MITEDELDYTAIALAGLGFIILFVVISALLSRLF